MVAGRENGREENTNVGNREKKEVGKEKKERRLRGKEVGREERKEFC